MIRRLVTHLAAERLHPPHLLYGVAAAVVVTALGEFAPPVLSATHLALMYLLAVLIVAVRFGLWPALAGAVASVAALDYLFLQPLYSFTVNRPQDALLLAFLSIGAIIASGLAARLREQVAIAKRNEETTAALYRFAGRLAGTVTLDTAVATAVDQVRTMLSYRATVIVGDSVPPAAALTLPLRAAAQVVGVMTLDVPQDVEITPEERRLVEALAELAGIAIGRQVLADRLAQLSIEKEADRLRSALLNSIAHDLTAPIASVATALSSLADDYDALDDETRRALISEAEREAEHLHQFSANLIQIARLESGTIELRREPTDIADLIGHAVTRANALLSPRRVTLALEADLPLVSVDFTLMEQAIFHLLENAGKYSPPEATITITAEPVRTGVAIMIADDGPGFPAADSERIFTKFYRAASALQREGTGLGLAICRGFIEAHAGTISAANRAGGGAVFTIWLPASREC